jgi:hypothetical protein
MLPDTQETLAKARLYTLRVWAVRNNSEAAEWRARLQDTQSGEVIYFRNWQEFVEHMQNALQDQIYDFRRER